MSDGPSADAARVSESLEAARRILVLTGAGVSAESGIPTFRGQDGWWRRLDPARLATRTAFDSDPTLVWEWYQHRRGLVRDATPNRAHRAIAAWEDAGKDVLVATQNVDDLHERSGSRRVAHIHGSIWAVRCEGCGIEREERAHPLPALPPRCECGALLRPGVVWFDEALPADPIAEIEAFLDRPCDLTLLVGTEVSFGYIARWADAARWGGALLVEVNPSRTRMSDHVDVRLEGPAGVLLPSLAGPAPATE